MPATLVLISQRLIKKIAELTIYYSFYSLPLQGLLGDKYFKAISKHHHIQRIP